MYWSPGLKAERPPLSYGRIYETLIGPSGMSNDGSEQLLLSRKYFRGLDGLRGVAIGIVMMHHFQLATAVRTGPIRLMRVFEKGWAGVDLFFVLSGFLITRILLEAKERGVPLRLFYARRALRIFPLYYLVLCLVAILPAIVTALGYAPSPPAHTIWLWSYLSNVPKAFASLSQPSGGLLVVGHFWTLAIEEQFYLLWPSLVMWLSIRRFWTVALCCLPLSLCVKAVLLHFGVPALRADYFTLVRMDGLCVGALLACMVRSATVVKEFRRGSVRAAVLCAALCVGVSLAKTRAPYLTTLTNHLTLSLLFGTITAIVVSSGDRALVNRVLGCGPLVWLGRRSYGLYVWHYLLIGVTVRGLKASGVLHPGAIGDLELVFALFVLSCGVAAASWAVLEKRFILAKRHFEYAR